MGKMDNEARILLDDVIEFCRRDEREPRLIHCLLYTSTMHGVETTIRNSRGSDIDAACGQLKQRRFRVQ